MNWTVEREDYLRFLLADAGKSCSQIARMMDVSRNAIIGKANRMGLAKRERGRRPDPKPEKIVERKKYVRPISVALIQHTPVAIVALDGGVPLLLLRHHHCRALVGKGEDGLATFCGQHKAPVGSYCPGHALRYYRPPDRR